MRLYLRSSSMIVTVDEEILSANDKQLGSNLIATSNVSTLSRIILSIIPISKVVSNVEDGASAAIAILNTDCVIL